MPFFLCATHLRETDNGLQRLETALGQTSPVAKEKAAQENRNHAWRREGIRVESVWYPYSLTVRHIIDICISNPSHFLHAPSHSSFHVRNLSIFLCVSCALHTWARWQCLSPGIILTNVPTFCRVRLNEVFFQLQPLTNTAAWQLGCCCAEYTLWCGCTSPSYFILVSSSSRQAAA